MNRITLKQASRWLAPRARGAHKGDAGRVFILAGSRGMAGAAVLSSSARFAAAPDSSGSAPWKANSRWSRGALRSK
jgi:NAD(P)H-hydrate epimerase